MYNPGYVAVDCKGLDLLSDSSQTVPGLYAEVKEAVDGGKAIYAANCEYGEGVPVTPIPVFCILEGGVYVFTASILQVRVASNDSVTIVPLIGG